MKAELLKQSISVRCANQDGEKAENLPIQWSDAICAFDVLFAKGRDEPENLLVPLKHKGSGVEGFEA